MARIETEEGLRDVRIGVDDIFDIILANWPGFKNGVAKRFHEFGGQSSVACAANIAQIEIVDLCEGHEQFRAHGALIALDQIDVAG